MAKVKIRMLRDERGSDDGPNGEGEPVKAFVAGSEYEVGPNLARAFVDEMNAAERVGLAGVADAVSGAVEAVAEAAGDAVAAVTGKGKRKKPDDPDAA